MMNKLGTLLCNMILPMGFPCSVGKLHIRKCILSTGISVISCLHRYFSDILSALGGLLLWWHIHTSDCPYLYGFPVKGTCTLVGHGLNVVHLSKLKLQALHAHIIRVWCYETSSVHACVHWYLCCICLRTNTCISSVFMQLGMVCVMQLLMVCEYALLSSVYGMIVFLSRGNTMIYVIFLNIHIRYTCIKDIWYVH